MVICHPSCESAKYSSIFLCKIKAIVFIILQIFCNVHKNTFTNSLLFAAWDFFLFVSFGMTFQTNIFQKLLMKTKFENLKIKEYHLGEQRGGSALLTEC